MNQKLLKGMKWLNKFENGGRVENTLRKVMSSLTSLIKRSQKNDPEAKKQIQAILDDPNAQQMLAMIEQQSPELIEALHAEVQDVQMAQTGGAVEYLDSLKCGGRVKKAKKKEEGGEMTKNRIKTNRLAKGAKAPCPCSLKRIGGTIIEVDCEGIPVHKVGGKVQKFRLGRLINRVLTFGQPKRKTIISPEYWISTTNAPYSYGHDKDAFHPDAKGLFFIPGRGLVWEADPDFFDEPTAYPKKENFMAYPHDNEDGALEGQIPPDLIPGDTYLEYPTLRVGSRLSDAQTVLNEQSKNTKEAVFQPLTPKADELSSDKLQAAMERQQAAMKKAEADKKAAVARDAKVKTFYSRMSDSDKRALQDMLKSAGYYKGEIDGLIGNVTLDALKKFQQDNKLAVDGMAGRNTIDALRAKTRQVAQPVTDLTTVPGYTQAMQILNQMNGSANAAPVKTGGPTGGMGLNDVRQGKEIPLVGPSISLNLTPGLDVVPQRKQGGWLTKFN